MQNQSSKSKMAAPNTRQKKKWRRADNRKKKWRPTHTRQNQKKMARKKKKGNTKYAEKMALKNYLSSLVLLFFSSHTHER